MHRISRHKSKIFVLIKRKTYKIYYSVLAFCMLIVTILVCFGCKPMAKIETNEQQLDTIAKDSVSQRFVDTIVLKTDTVANEFFGPNLNDSVTYLPDNPMLDSLLMPQDSILSDSLAQPKDTIVTKRSSAALETKSFVPPPIRLCAIWLTRKCIIMAMPRQNTTTSC